MFKACAARVSEPYSTPLMVMGVERGCSNPALNDVALGFPKK